MASSYKLKLILGGSSGSGKTTFLHGTPVFDSPIGVSFKTVECIANDGDNYTFMVWDLKATPRFHFLYEGFCRGACAAILCFDTSNYDSFIELTYWIDLVRGISGLIPIFIVGTKIDLIGQVVSEGEIEDFIDRNDLTGVYFTSNKNQTLLKRTKEKIFKNLVENVHPRAQIQEFSILTESKELKEFLEYFSDCPVCGVNNHKDNLKNFFKSRAPFFAILREKLCDLVERSVYFEKDYYNSIKIGIPCCKCHKEIFGRT